MNDITTLNDRKRDPLNVLYQIMYGPKYPCRNCTYFKQCGNTNRTQPCGGRQTKTQAIKFHTYDNVAEPLRTELKNKYVERK